MAAFFAHVRDTCAVVYEMGGAVRILGNVEPNLW